AKQRELGGFFEGVSANGFSTARDWLARTNSGTLIVPVYQGWIAGFWYGDWTSENESTGRAPLRIQLGSVSQVFSGWATASPGGAWYDGTHVDGDVVLRQTDDVSGECAVTLGLSALTHCDAGCSFGLGERGKPQCHRA